MLVQSFVLAAPGQAPQAIMISKVSCTTTGTFMWAVVWRLTVDVRGGASAFEAATETGGAHRLTNGAFEVALQLVAPRWTFVDAWGGYRALSYDAEFVDNLIYRRPDTDVGGDGPVGMPVPLR